MGGGDINLVIFQSTLPRRERLKQCGKDRIGKYFNPRSHAGSDGVQQEIFHIIPNFNPRSHAGSDINSIDKLSENIHFNPRSHAGSDVMML